MKRRLRLFGKLYDRIEASTVWFKLLLPVRVTFLPVHPVGAAGLESAVWPSSY